MTSDPRVTAILEVLSEAFEEPDRTILHDAAGEILDRLDALAVGRGPMRLLSFAKLKAQGAWPGSRAAFLRLERDCSYFPKGMKLGNHLVYDVREFDPWFRRYRDDAQASAAE